MKTARGFYWKNEGKTDLFFFEKKKSAGKKDVAFSGAERAAGQGGPPSAPARKSERPSECKRDPAPAGERSTLQRSFWGVPPVARIACRLLFGGKAFSAGGFPVPSFCVFSSFHVAFSKYSGIFCRSPRSPGKSKILFSLLWFHWPSKARANYTTLCTKSVSNLCRNSSQSYKKPL